MSAAELRAHINPPFAGIGSSLFLPSHRYPTAIHPHVNPWQFAEKVAELVDALLKLTSFQMPNVMKLDLSFSSERPLSGTRHWDCFLL